MKYNETNSGENVNIIFDTENANYHLQNNVFLKHYYCNCFQLVSYNLLNVVHSAHMMSFKMILYFWKKFYVPCKY